VLTALALAGLSASGCLWWNPEWTAPKQTPVPAAADNPAGRPAITADLVTESNARQAADALDDELKREAQGNSNPEQTPADPKHR
jgi:hypothetical protein